MPRALVINAKDNVGVALDDLEPGVTVSIKKDKGPLNLEIRQPIPFGHKFSIITVKKGQEIIKYGEIIGRASEDIPLGHHVHIHNIEGTRGRGDLAGGKST